MPIQCSRGCALDHRAMAAERRLGVVEHCTAQAAVGHHDRVAGGNIGWLGADAESDHHADVFSGGPERLLLLAVVVALRDVRSDGEKGCLENRCAAKFKFVYCIVGISI
ncbi:hypothetical protein A8144_09570 [Mycobacterium leprae 3125609]|nr:hypothetical protein A8144_09570 [Mycobacterium leprae 3125609]OAX70882.1 hypothetical protein A3216_09205 [Mycobacterium leprae 7935681]